MAVGRGKPRVAEPALTRGVLLSRSAASAKRGNQPSGRQSTQPRLAEGGRS